MSTSFCKKCGNEISSDVKFCGKCGDKVIDDSKISKAALPTHGHLLKDDEEFGGFMIRLGAYLIDYVIGGLGLSFVLGILIYLTNPSSAFFDNMTTGMDRFFTLSMVIIYVSICLSITSTTIGKYFYGLRVIDKHGNKISVRKAIGRSLGYFVSSLVFGLGFLKIINDKNKQSWHDGQAETFVIRDKNKNLTIGVVLSLVSFCLIIWAMYSGYSSNTSSSNSVTKSESSLNSWYNYVSAEDSFTILLPKYPTFTKEENIPIDGSGVTYSYHQYQSSEGSSSFFVFKYLYSDKLDIQDKDKLLNSYLNQMLNSNKSTLISSSFGYYSGYRTLDYMIDIKDERLKGRFILVGETPYTLMMDYYPANYNEEKYNKFINSFTVQF